jgi:serum/glucocorticoid-regulated kinase 2
MNNMNKNMSIQDFALLRVIGKGSYAKVLLVKKKDTETVMALKVLKKEMIERRKQKGHVLVERDVLVTRASPVV